MKSNKPIILAFTTILAVMLFNSCRQSQVIQETRPVDKNREFLKEDKNAKDLFRVLLTSDEYLVAQMNYKDVIERVPDKGGDEYMTEEMKKYDIIDEEKEAVLKVWLYPDMPGRIMKIRPQIPSYLLEIDELLTDDIQRWNFNFPKKYVAPTNFTIRYKIVLRKGKSDKEVLKDIKDLMRKDK